MTLGDAGSQKKALDTAEEEYDPVMSFVEARSRGEIAAAVVSTSGYGSDEDVYATARVRAASDVRVWTGALLLQHTANLVSPSGAESADRGDRRWTPVRVGSTTTTTIPSRTRTTAKRACVSLFPGKAVPFRITTERRVAAPPQHRGAAGVGAWRD